MKKTNLGQALLEGLGEAKKWHRGQITLRTHEVELPAEPKAPSKTAIKVIREKKLGMSQPILAHFLGVHPSTIKNWEQGLGKPNGPAIRLLRIAEKAPELFMELVLGTDQNSRSTKKSAG